MTMPTIACSSGESFSTVTVNAAEADIISRLGVKEGFDAVGRTYSADPEAITTAAKDLEAQVNAAYTGTERGVVAFLKAVPSKLSWATGIGSTGNRAELVIDGKRVAKAIAERGKGGSSAEAPSINPKDSWKITNAARRAISWASHCLADHAGKLYRTY